MTPRATRLLVIAAIASCAVIASCSGQRAAPEAGASGSIPRATGPALRFAFRAVDGRPVSIRSLANRVSVIGFLTTYDMSSQIEARFLATLERRHTPRVNVAVLMLEAPENQPLVEAFATSLRLAFPVAIADEATIAGEGPFAGLHHVPSVVVLDRAGREAWRRVGLVNDAVLEAAVRAVEATSPPAARSPDDDPDGG